MLCSEPGLANYTFSIFNVVLGYSTRTIVRVILLLCVWACMRVLACVCVYVYGTEANAHCPPFIKPRKFVQIATEPFN